MITGQNYHPFFTVSKMTRLLSDELYWSFKVNRLEVKIFSQINV